MVVLDGKNYDHLLVLVEKNDGRANFHPIVGFCVMVSLFYVTIVQMLIYHNFVTFGLVGSMKIANQLVTAVKRPIVIVQICDMSDFEMNYNFYFARWYAEIATHSQSIIAFFSIGSADCCSFIACFFGL